MTVNKTFYLEIKARVKNEKIGIFLFFAAMTLLAVTLPNTCTNILQTSNQPNNNTFKNKYQ